MSDPKTPDEIAERCWYRITILERGIHDGLEGPALIRAALAEAVAARDAEWTTALGTSLNHRGEGVTPEWMASSYAQHQREMERKHREAVAEEWKALRKVVQLIADEWGSGQSAGGRYGTCSRILAALDAREKESR